jgi:molybdate transport system substrate-binding protein
MVNRMLRNILLLCLTLSVYKFSYAADIKVLISSGFFGVYHELGPIFEKKTGHKLITVRGPSIGDSPEAIPTRLARGETADLVILDGEAAHELAHKGFVKESSVTILGLSQIGMAIKEGATKPDISTVDAFRKTLLDAKSIGYSDSGSGTYIAGQMFKKLGIEDQVKGKSKKVRGPPSGEPVAATVARGENEIGFQQVSEILHVSGITYVGPIPKEVQPGFTFAGAVTTASKQEQAAIELIKFLRAPEAEAVIVKAGLGYPR